MRERQRWREKAKRAAGTGWDRRRPGAETARRGAPNCHQQDQRTDTLSATVGGPQASVPHSPWSSLTWVSLGVGLGALPWPSLVWGQRPWLWWAVPISP